MSRNSFTCPTIDFVFLQDLSGSFADDLPILKSQIANVIATVEDISAGADFGVASFIDKPNGTFANLDEYVYKTHLAISSDNSAVISAVNALTTNNGLDEPEAQIEALMQVALRQDEVGYRPDTMRIVMLSTDSSFHKAGDFPAGAANNGDAVLDGGGTGEDYPSIAQTAAALVAAGVFPVFSVTAAQKALYTQLVADLGTGAVVVLSSNSSDFADAVRVAVAKACGHVTHEGTEIEDEIHGTEIEDGIFGLGGDDILDGRKGHDLLDGGSGNDDLSGGAGDDDLYGGTGDDVMRGGAGRDTLSGGIGTDTMTGGRGRDTFVINPGDGSDIITDFENGKDRIDLSALHRHEGVSAVMNAVQNGTDVLLMLPAGTGLTLRGFSLADLGLEDVILSPVGDPPVAVDDTATVTAGKRVVIDAVANDTDIDGDSLSVVSAGTPAHGTVTVRANGKIVYTADAGYTGTDSFSYTMTDGAFTDIATVTVTITPNLIGDGADNVLTGTEGNDIIKGFGGNDTIDGRGGIDTIRGGTGNDTISGGLGNDVIHGGKGADIITAGPAGGMDQQDNDTVYGQGGRDRISGSWGDDHLDGGAGGDTIGGDQGDDKLFGRGGRDTLDGGTGNDEVWGGAGDDTITGGDGNDQLRGDGGSDTIDGGAGRDHIYASGGGTGDNDILTGGAGADVFIFDLALDRNLNGDDRITDYDIAEDRILLDGDVLVSLTDTASGVLIEQATGGSILVENVLAVDIRTTIDGLNELIV